MKQYYIMGNNFVRITRDTSNYSFTKKYKSKKHKWTSKEKELISKYRKGLIWKDI